MRYDPGTSGARTGMTAAAFHDFSNTTRALIWQAVHLLAESRVTRAENHVLREHVRDARDPLATQTPPVLPRPPAGEGR